MGEGGTAFAAPGDPTAGARDLDALLSANGEQVASLLRDVQTEVEASVKPEQYDDVWGLRYVLSFADHAKRIAAAKKTIAWRDERAEMLEAAAREQRLPRFASIEKYVAADYHGVTHGGQPIYLIRAGISNPKAIMDTMPKEGVLDFMMYRREIGFVKCDKITRTTRTLCKMVTVNDLNHVSLLSGTEKRFTAMLGEASELSEVLYPQLLDRAVLINVPYFFSAIWSVVKNVMSAKTRSKVAVCPGDTLKGDISTCPFAKLIDLKTVPTFLGGGCKCKGGCICGTPNEQTHKVGNQDSDGMTLATVAARDKFEAYHDVEVGDRVGWELKVESQGVEVTVRLKEEGLNRSTPVTLVPKFKHKADDGLKQDVVVAPSKGTLVFTFDNSYSYLNSKSIRYRIQTIEEGKAVPST